MQVNPRFRHVAMYALLLTFSSTLMAQGKHGRSNMPPGQAKKHERSERGQARNYDRNERGLPPGQAKRLEEGRRLPPGQAKKYFREQDRARFYTYYRRDADRWRGRRRPDFVVGRYIARRYVMRPVPWSLWVNIVAPPPPGYRYGYYGGYVVAYNPTTRIIADVLDLVDAVHSR